jgi:hypothetical protein
MIFRSDDLPIFFRDFSVNSDGKPLLVQFNGTSVLGILDQPGGIALADSGFGGIQADRLVLTLPGNAFSPMPQNLDTITVDGDVYTIAQRMSDGDGGTVQYSLKGTQ